MFLFQKIAFPLDWVYVQKAPNIDMWLVLSHLGFVHFFNSSCESLELICEFSCLCLSLHGLFSEHIQYLHCNILADHLYALCLSLLDVLLCLLCLCNDFHCYLLERFHLILSILLLFLHSYELILQFLHFLYSFEVLSDLHRIMPFLEDLDSYAYLFLFLVPLLDFLILL
jgi:hypothetical protein